MTRAKFIQVLAALSLAFPPILCLIAMVFHYAGSNLASSLILLVFLASFVCIFVSLILVLIALVLMLFGIVESKHIRFGAVLALLAFFLNSLIFSFLVFNFYRPH